MSKGRKTIVRHADGTVSKRTSQSKVYSHAVEIEETPRYRRERIILGIESGEREIGRLEKALDRGGLVDDGSVWSIQGREIVSHRWYFGGIYVGHADTMTEAEGRARVEEYLWNTVEGQARNIERLEAVEGSEFGVMTWASRLDLAQKAARRYDRDVAWGAIVRVVECEEA